MCQEEEGAETRKTEHGLCHGNRESWMLGESGKAKGLWEWAGHSRYITESNAGGHHGNSQVEMVVWYLAVGRQFGARARAKEEAMISPNT